MDRTSLLFLILVIVLGGFIALYADRFGRELGKKRLRLAGLRPRRTAEIIVFSAGVLAPLLAILVLMGVSAEARLWIARGYRAVQDARNADDAKKRAIAQYELILIKSRQLDSQIRDLEARLESMRKQSDTYSVQAKQSEQRAKEAVQKASGLDRRVFELGGQVKQRQELLGKLQSDLSASRDRLGSLTQSYNTLQKQRVEADAEVLRLAQQIGSLESQIQTGEGDLKDLQNELEKRQKELAAAEEARRLAVDSLNAELTQLNTELERARQQVSFATQRIQDLAQEWLNQPMIFQIGEEVIRSPLDRQLSALEAQRALESALRSARVIASERGARPNAEGYEADLIDLFTRDDQRVTVAQQREAIVRALTGRGQESLLVISVRFNAFRNQFVPLDVQIFNNPIVFEEGELLGEERIDANASVGKIIEQVTNLLSTTVRRKAEERKMIIAAGGDGLGRIDPAEVYAMVSTVQNLQRVVRLQALAKTQTRAGGPLAIEFRFR